RGDLRLVRQRFTGDGVPSERCGHVGVGIRTRRGWWILTSRRRIRRRGARRRRRHVGSAVTGLVGFGHLFRMPEIGESEATREIPCGAANGPMPSRTPAGRLLSAPPTGTVRGRRPGGEL